MEYTKEKNLFVGFSSYQKAVKDSPAYPISDRLRAKSVFLYPRRVELLE